MSRNCLMTQQKNPMSQIWGMTHRLGTTDLDDKPRYDS